MSIQAVVEYNDKGFLIYVDGFPGAFTRGEDKNEALEKLPKEVEIYCRWAGKQYPSNAAVNVIQDEYKDISIEDADSEVIFNSERLPLSGKDYQALKALIFKSTKDVINIFSSIPDKSRPLMQPRETFHGNVPVTAIEMLSHINEVTKYYSMQVGVSIENSQNLLINRELAFLTLEKTPDYLDNKAAIGSFGEEWSLRKVMRRFIWHDRIHIRAMYRRANAIWNGKIENPFFFTV